MENPGAISIVPIILTLALALWSRNVILGLFVGVFSGVLILNGPNPVTAVSIAIDDYMITQMSSRSNSSVLILIALIGGLVGLMEKSGGAFAFAATMTRFITNKLTAQLAVWVAGIMVFFSDKGTPLLVGPIFRPITDKLKISRVKLAWMVDSTASPVCVLIPFIGWGVYIQSLIKNEYMNLGIGGSEWEAFMKALPFQFYSILAVVMVPLIAFTKFDFGLMKKFEDQYQTPNDDDKDGIEPAVEFETREKARASFVWLPLLIMTIVLLSLLLPQGFPFERLPSGAFISSLSTSYLFASTALIFLMAFLGAKRIEEGFLIYFKSIGNIVSILIVLVLAWSLGAISKDLQTAQYIVGLAKGGFSPTLVPAVAFVIGAIISFATGSSWGTYAIMLPLIIGVAHELESPMYVCIGAVLSGGLFGDHSSPISDTTIVSATGAGCSPLDHVRTQLPYALVNGAVCIIAFVLAGITGSAWSLLLGFLMLTGAIFALNRLSP